jgi:hypothetical protein
LGFFASQALWPERSRTVELFVGLFDTFAKISYKTTISGILCGGISPGRASGDCQPPSTV